MSCHASTQYSEQTDEWEKICLGHLNQPVEYPKLNVIYVVYKHINVLYVDIQMYMNNNGANMYRVKKITTTTTYSWGPAGCGACPLPSLYIHFVKMSPFPHPSAFLFSAEPLCAQSPGPKHQHNSLLMLVPKYHTPTHSQISFYAPWKLQALTVATALSGIRSQPKYITTVHMAKHKPAICGAQPGRKAPKCHLLNLK